MKSLKQFLIIGTIAFLGDILNGVIPLPIPGGIWGMALLLCLLISGVIKLHQIEKTADFLISIMAVMFVPYVADFILMYDQISDKFLELGVIIVSSTFITMVITGATVQKMRKMRKKLQIIEEDVDE
jgi:holin-like protein